jgi:anti-sigma factor RsiW
MSSAMRTMLTCRWAARRIQRYLDADPSAPLDPGEVRRLEAHLATCTRCTALTEEYRGLHRALMTWATRRIAPEQQALARLHRVADQLVREGRG